MDETRFHTLADATLTHCFDQLEAAFDAGDLEDLELQNGILTIATADHTFLLNKHAPSQQLWLASPRSGGLHFSYAADTQRWMLSDGTALFDLLRQELAADQVTVEL